MIFNGIANKYNEPLEAAQAHIHDDRYDMVECGDAMGHTGPLRSAMRL